MKAEIIFDTSAFIMSVKLQSIFPRRISGLFLEETYEVLRILEAQ